MITERKVAIVTGGGTGIGRAISLKLAQEGCVVAVVYSRSATEAEETVNLKGTFNCCRAAAPYLRATQGSAIVNVGSIAGETVHGLTKSLARVLAPQVRVNCIAPGAVATRWWSGYEEKMRTLSGVLPLQRISTPEDIAESVFLLLTSQSVTAQILKAENGQTL